MIKKVHWYFHPHKDGIDLENQQLGKELHKSVIGKFKKQSVHSSLKNTILGVDSADMQLISKYNKGIRFLLCVCDIYSK